MTGVFWEGEKFLYLKNILCISNYRKQRSDIPIGVIERPVFTLSQITTSKIR
jgi:hypothetical protein